MPSALVRYEALRRPRTSRVQEISRGNAKRFHLPDGPRQRERDALMATGSTDWSVHAAAWIYQHDATIIDADGA